VILSVVAGAVISAEDAIEEALLPTVLYAKDTATATFRDWPETGSRRKNYTQALAHINNVKSDLDSADAQLPGILLVTLAQFLLTDLSERVSTKRKLQLIEPLAEAIDGLHDLLDPEGENLTAFAEAEKLEKVVFQEIGW